MINACQVCENVAKWELEVGQKIKAEKERVTKTFCENIISPVLSKLTVIPKDYLIGYYVPTFEMFCEGTTEWYRTRTSRGYIKEARDFCGCAGLAYDRKYVDFDYIKAYLNEFGFSLRVEKDRFFEIAKYETKRPGTIGLYKLYITINC